MSKSTRINWRALIKLGLVAGLISLGVSVIGMVDTFNQRDLINEIVSLGQVFLFASAIGAGYLAVKQSGETAASPVLLNGAIVGAIASVFLVVLVLIGSAVDLREIGLVNISPVLIEEILSFGNGPVMGSLILFLTSTGLGMLGAVSTILPHRIRHPLMTGLMWTLGAGLMSEILTAILRPLLGNSGISFMFKAKALTPIAAVIVFVLSIGATILWEQKSESIKAQVDKVKPKEAKKMNWLKIGASLVILVLLPHLLGTYLSEVVNNVGLYILMGLGLNIVIGFAGLLDLGYVAFFAIGAYTMGILTSQGPLGMDVGFSFWTALPIAVAISVTAGIILGIPVLRMRGDYLAIVTLGFGEIIRILAVSDVLKPFMGGAQGVLQIPKAQVAGIPLVSPQQLYYLILGGVLIALFVSTRLRDSRMGRQWMAMREDEDVAEAMGINLVKTKLMAFATGAAFSGFSGAIFAVKLGSIFPHSFALIISINVLSLIIVGGMGSFPGVAIGALALIGLPELLREFAEYRFLMYGVLLIVMMLSRPEGLLPSAVRKRELHIDESDAVAAD